MKKKNNNFFKLIFLWPSNALNFFYIFILHWFYFFILSKRQDEKSGPCNFTCKQCAAQQMVKNISDFSVVPCTRTYTNMSRTALNLKHWLHALKFFNYLKIGSSFYRFQMRYHAAETLFRSFWMWKCVGPNRLFVFFKICATKLINFVCFGCICNASFHEWILTQDCNIALPLSVHINGSSFHFKKFSLGCLTDVNGCENS